MNKSFTSLASPGGKRAPEVFSRTMVYLLSLALVLTGVIPPGLGLAQVTTNQVGHTPAPLLPLCSSE